MLASFFQMVVYTKSWLSLQANASLDEPHKPAAVQAPRTGRDALDDKLDAELSKLDD